MGSRIRVVRGRQFRDFGAGDTGVVVRVDWPSQMCEVAFDGHGPVAAALPVAMRHLEPERSHAAPALLSPRGQKAAEELLWSPERESAFQQQPLMKPQSALALAAGARAEDLAYERALREQQERIRLEATELRRMAAFSDASPAAPAAAVAAAPVTPGLGASAASAALVNAMEDEEALAAAVQASATATAAARVTGMMEVASLRSSINELRELIVHEAKQRVAGLQEISLDLERFTREMELVRADMALRADVRAELEGMSGKHVDVACEIDAIRTRHGELESLCLTLQESRSTEAERHGAKALDAARDLLEQRLAPVHGTLESMSGLASRIESLAKLQEWADVQERRHMELHASLEGRDTALEARMREFAESQHGSLLQRLEERRHTELHASLNGRDAALEARLREFAESHHGNLLQRLEANGRELKNALSDRDDRFRQFSIFHDGHNGRLDDLTAKLEDLSKLHGDRHRQALDHWEQKFALVDQNMSVSSQWEQKHALLSQRLSGIEQWEQKFVLLDQRLSSIAQWEQRFDNLSSRIDGVVQRGLLSPEQRERERAQASALEADRESLSRRLDSLAARLDAHTSELANKADREAALAARIDEVVKHFGAEVARHDASHDMKLGELAKVEDKTRELLESHISFAREKERTLNGQLSSRIDALAEGLATEARIREEAVRNLESFCRSSEDLLRRSTAAAVAPAQSSADLEQQLKTLLSDVREEVEFGRREEANRHHEAEISRRRLRLELDGLREDVGKREFREQRALPVTAGVTRQVLIPQPNIPFQLSEVPVVQVNSPGTTRFLTARSQATQELRLPDAPLTPPASSSLEATTAVPLTSVLSSLPALQKQSDVTQRWSSTPAANFRSASPTGTPGGAREVPVIVETTTAPLRPKEAHFFAASR